MYNILYYSRQTFFNSKSSRFKKIIPVVPALFSKFLDDFLRQHSQSLNGFTQPIFVSSYTKIFRKVKFFLDFFLCNV